MVFRSTTAIHPFYRPRRFVQNINYTGTRLNAVNRVIYRSKNDGRYLYLYVTPMRVTARYLGLTIGKCLTIFHHNVPTRLSYL